jgi:hypothetical protein
MSCEHKKVYAPYGLMSNPPQWPWICSECGEEGVDRDEKAPYIPSYFDLVKKKRNPNRIEFQNGSFIEGTHSDPSTNIRGASSANFIWLDDKEE